MNNICQIDCAYRTPSGYCGSTGGYISCQYRLMHSSPGRYWRCNGCIYDPPSSTDGKPCTVCDPTYPESDCYTTN